MKFTAFAGQTTLLVGRLQFFFVLFVFLLKLQRNITIFQLNNVSSWFGSNNCNQSSEDAIQKVRMVASELLGRHSSAMLVGQASIVVLYLRHG